jgi:uncharacterized protein (TIGR03437 family)
MPASVTSFPPRPRASFGMVVIAKTGGVDLSVLYAGPQGSFAGLDQAGVFLPLSLRGSGSVDIAVAIDGEWSNPCRISIQHEFNLQDLEILAIAALAIRN